MNKFYAIVPAALLGLFLFFYTGFLKEMNLKDARIAAEVTAKKQAAAAAKKDAEQKAAEDARQRQEQREREDREKEEGKRHAQAEIDAKIAADTQKYLDEVDRNTKENAKLEAELEALRAQREALSREDLELAKATELGRVARRTTDLEIQRMTEMVSRKIAQTALVRPPAADTP